MTTAVVVYHHEDDAWWAESPDVDGFSAVGATIGEVRALAREGVSFYLDQQVDLDEQLEGGAPLDVDLTRAVSRRPSWWSETVVQVQASLTGSGQRPRWSMDPWPQMVNSR